MRSMLRAGWRWFGAGVLAWGLSACGGSGGGDVAPTSATPPTITVQPAPAAVEPGTPVSFSVTATGTAPLSYQWQRDGSNIAGATSATLSLATTDLADNGSSLRVIVTNAAGSATSAPALLTVAVTPSAPRVVISPQSTRANDGEQVTLTVSAEGTQPLRYQWRRNGTAIADATSPSLTTSALGLGDTGTRYDVLVSNALGTVTSEAATVTVDAVPARITAEPADLAVVSGQPATFRAEATGSAPLTWQWRRNGVDIAGATGPSFTLATAAPSDHGALFSVVVRNAGGTSASRAASLSVTATSVAPTIATAPAALTVAEGDAAIFSVVANGTAPLAFQWQRNGVDVTGAIGDTFTLPAAALSDNGARYSVRVANAAGAVTSTEALLTVRPNTSLLAGRKWAAGQLLETDDNPVYLTRAGIDDQGRVIVAYIKSNGSRAVVFATRGAVGAEGRPVWSTPQPIDVTTTGPVSTMSTRELLLAVSPAGHAAAVWYHNAPCTAASYRTSGTCRYYQIASYSADSGTWTAPQPLTNAPDPEFVLRINDRGDVALLGLGWVRSGSSSYTSRRMLYLRSAGESAFRQQDLGGDPLSDVHLNLDPSGNLLLAAEWRTSATTDIAVYRGTVAAGVGAANIIDTRGSAADLRLAGVGIGGQQLVLWNQNNGVRNTGFAAVAADPSGEWILTDLGVPLDDFLVGGVRDDGRAFVIDVSARRRMTQDSAGSWGLPQSLPSDVRHIGYQIGWNRNGDMLIVSLHSGSHGATASYDGLRNAMVTTRPTTSPDERFLLGIAKNVDAVAPLLSVSGIGFTMAINGYDVLPTPTAPSGDQRTVDSLWAWLYR